MLESGILVALQGAWASASLQEAGALRFYGFDLFKTPQQSAAGKNANNRLLLGEMLKDHVS